MKREERLHPKNKLLRKIKNLLKLIWLSGFRYFTYSMIKPPYKMYCMGKRAEVFSYKQEGMYLEVFINDCYDLRGYCREFKPRVIADIGANVGFFSKLCALYFPHAQIYAYEPGPNSFKWLKKNAEGAMIRPYEAAVMSRGGHFVFRQAVAAHI
jgi:hypothetical protein